MQGGVAFTLNSRLSDRVSRSEMTPRTCVSLTASQVLMVNMKNGTSSRPKEATLVRWVLQTGSWALRGVDAAWHMQPILLWWYSWIV